MTPTLSEMKRLIPKFGDKKLQAEARKMIKSIEESDKRILATQKLLEGLLKKGLPGVPKSLVKRRNAPDVAGLSLKQPPKKASEKAIKYRVLIQEWVVRDSWSGPEEGGYSMHLSEQDRVAFINKVCAWRTGLAPETYDSPEGRTFWAWMNAKTYRRLLSAANKGEPGIQESISGRFKGLIER